MRAPSDFETLDEALRAVVGPRNDSGLTVAEWAHRLGYAESTVYAKGTPGVPFTLKDLVQVTANGFLLPLKWLARVAHCVVFQLPRALEGRNPLNERVAESTIKFGEYLKSVAEALDPAGPGGVEVVPVEARLVKARAEEVIADLAAVVEAMNQVLKAEKVVGDE